METRLRVLFDAYWWTRGPASNRTVQREIIAAWIEAFPDDDIALAVRSGSTAEPDLPKGVETYSTHLWPHGVSNAVELGRIARRFRADVVVAHNFAPVDTRSLVFVHDAIFIEHRDWFSRAERLYFAGMLPLARRSTVVTSSKAEAARIERLRPNLAPVRAVGLAINPALTGNAVRPTEVELDLAFAVTVGRLNVRKNLGSLLDAVSQCNKITPDSPLLVVGGTEHSGMPPTLSPQHEELVRSGRVRFLGFVTDTNLAWLYRNAAVFVTLSRDEGFGLTPLEAAAAGCPIVASDIPPHREVLGAMATFVPLDAPPGQVAGVIDSVWGRKSHSPDATSLSERYSWGTCAGRLRDVALNLVKETSS